MVLLSPDQGRGEGRMWEGWAIDDCYYLAATPTPPTANSHNPEVPVGVCKAACGAVLRQLPHLPHLTYPFWDSYHFLQMNWHIPNYISSSANSNTRASPFHTCFACLQFSNAS